MHFLLFSLDMYECICADKPYMGVFMYSTFIYWLQIRQMLQLFLKVVGFLWSYSAYVARLETQYGIINSSIIFGIYNYRRVSCT